MTTLDDKLEAVKTSLIAHGEGRLSDEELKKLAKVIDRTPTSQEEEDQQKKKDYFFTINSLFFIQKN